MYLRYMTKECKIHGLVGTNSNGRCKKCAVEAVQKRREKIKQMAVEYKGGKCEICGYDKCIWALDFHHIDESTKEFGIGQYGYTRSWEEVRNEIDKCMLVCSNCHREIHHGQVTQR